MLATVEVIIYNLPFPPGKLLWNAFIEDWPQGLLGFKLLVECDSSLCFLISLFLVFFEKKSRRTVTIHEKNWKLTSIITKQKINFFVIGRIK